MRVLEWSLDIRSRGILLPLRQLLIEIIVGDAVRIATWKISEPVGLASIFDKSYRDPTQSEQGALWPLRCG